MLYDSKLLVDTYKKLLYINKNTRTYFLYIKSSVKQLSIQKIIDVVSLFFNVPLN